MNWLIKVAAFKLLSGLPGGTAFYRFSQEKITRSLDPTKGRLEGKIAVALQYWDWLEANHIPSHGIPRSLLDFGAGWHPTIPLLFYSLGVERQYLCDVVPILNRDMIERTVTTFLSIVNDPAWPHRSRLRRLPEIISPQSSWSDYLKKIGITYHAPYDEKLKELVGMVDLVTSTQVLLHIPREILGQCFKSLYPCMKKNGKFIATVYLYDLHATATNGLSQYNHLRYSPEAWEKWVNSRLMSYNRLKARDYRELLEAAGFKLRHFEVTPPTTDDLRDLARIPVHECFSHYSQEELGAKNLYFVAEKE